MDQANYTINGYIPSLAHVPLTIINTGDYAVEKMIKKDGIVIMVWRLYVSLVNI